MFKALQWSWTSEVEFLAHTYLRPLIYSLPLSLCFFFIVLRSPSSAGRIPQGKLQQQQKQKQKKCLDDGVDCFCCGFFSFQKSAFFLETISKIDIMLKKKKKTNQTKINKISYSPRFCFPSKFLNELPQRRLIRRLKFLRRQPGS